MRNDVKTASSSIQHTIRIYKARGLDVRMGLSPWHFKRNAIKTFAMSSIFDGQSKLSTGGGIAMTEMFFFESLCPVWNPSNVFIIGNAFGLSSIFLSVLNPQATVVAIDAAVEGLDNDRGNQLTRQIALEEGLQLEVVHGVSPQDVPSIVKNRLNGKVDLVFIDGLHTEHQQELDFEACWEFGRDRAIYCFHDVLSFNMKPGFERISKRHPQLKSVILWRTPSGMGILYPPSVGSEVEETIQLFTEPDWMLEKTMREIARERLIRISGAFLLRGTLVAGIARNILHQIKRRRKARRDG